MATSERRKVIRPKAKSETDPLKTRPAARIRKKNNKDQRRRDVLVMCKRKATYRISQHCHSKKNTLDAAKQETGSGLNIGDSDSKSKGTRPITCLEKAVNVGGVPVTITLACHELLCEGTWFQRKASGATKQSKNIYVHMGTRRRTQWRR